MHRYRRAQRAPWRTTSALRYPENWWVEVVLVVDDQRMRCLIGPIALWTKARHLAIRWERAYGAGTTRVRSGSAPRGYRVAGDLPGIFQREIPAE